MMTTSILGTNQQLLGAADSPEVGWTLWRSILRVTRAAPRSDSGLLPEPSWGLSLIASYGANQGWVRPLLGWVIVELTIGPQEERGNPSYAIAETKLLAEDPFPGVVLGSELVQRWRDLRGWHQPHMRRVLLGQSQGAESCLYWGVYLGLPEEVLLECAHMFDPGAVLRLGVAFLNEEARSEVPGPIFQAVSQGPVGEETLTHLAYYAALALSGRVLPLLGIAGDGESLGYLLGGQVVVGEPDLALALRRVVLARLWDYFWEEVELCRFSLEERGDLSGAGTQG